MTAFDPYGSGSEGAKEPSKMKSKPQHHERRRFCLKDPSALFMPNYPNGGGDNTILLIIFIAWDIGKPPVTL